MKLLLTTLILIAGIKLGMTVYGSAPFCKVDNGGYMAQCYYYSLSSCRSMLGWGEFCIMNPNK